MRRRQFFAMLAAVLVGGRTLALAQRSRALPIRWFDLTSYHCAAVKSDGARCYKRVHCEGHYCELHGGFQRFLTERYNHFLEDSGAEFAPTHVYLGDIEWALFATSLKTMERRYDAPPGRVVRAPRTLIFRLSKVEPVSRIWAKQTFSGIFFQTKDKTVWGIA